MPRGKVIPLGYATPSSYARLQALMRDPQTILVEARATPDAPRRPEWRRWGERGLQRTWDPRYYYFSDRSYGSGGSTENWLGNKHDQQPELAVELVNAEQGIRLLSMEIARGKTVVLLCACKQYERCHMRVIVELLRQRFPDLQVGL